MDIGIAVVAFAVASAAAFGTGSYYSWDWDCSSAFPSFGSLTDLIGSKAENSKAFRSCWGRYFVERAEVGCCCTAEDSHSSNMG